MATNQTHATLLLYTPYSTCRNYSTYPDTPASKMWGGGTASRNTYQGKPSIIMGEGGNNPMVQYKEQANGFWLSKSLKHHLGNFLNTSLDWKGTSSNQKKGTFFS